VQSISSAQHLLLNISQPTKLPILQAVCAFDPPGSRITSHRLDQVGRSLPVTASHTEAAPTRHHPTRQQQLRASCAWQPHQHVMVLAMAFTSHPACQPGQPASQAASFARNSSGFCLNLPPWLQAFL
jgi:hypothetical protein